MKGIVLCVSTSLAFYSLAAICLALANHAETGARMLAVPFLVCGVVAVTAARQI